MIELTIGSGDITYLLGSKIWVTPYRIMSVGTSDNHKPGAVVVLESYGYHMYVQETPEDVLALIKEFKEKH